MNVEDWPHGIYSAQEERRRDRGLRIARRKDKHIIARWIARRKDKHIITRWIARRKDKHIITRWGVV